MSEHFETKNVAVDVLIPYAMNSRQHDETQVAQLAASIREFGFTTPILVDDKNNVIAGIRDRFQKRAHPAGGLRIHG